MARLNELRTEFKHLGNQVNEPFFQPDALAHGPQMLDSNIVKRTHIGGAVLATDFYGGGGKLSIEVVGGILGTLGMAKVFSGKYLSKIPEHGIGGGAASRTALSQSISPERQQQMITKLGDQLHDTWRAPRKLGDGTFDPRIKTTKDAAWIKKNGTDQVDIANTSFKDLPADWKGENQAAAEVAMHEVFKAVESGRTLDKNFIEEASAAVHKGWLERNGKWAEPHQLKPYAELSPAEQAKDRDQILSAIKIVQGYE